MKIRPWLQGGGLAMLYLLPPIADFLSPARRNFYHQLSPITTLTRGVLIDLLVLGLVWGAGFALLDRAAPRVKQILWLPVFLVTAWIVGRDTSSWMSGRGYLHLLRWVHYGPVVVLVVAVSLLLLAAPTYQRVTRVLAAVLAGGGISLLFLILPRLLWASFSNAPPEAAGFVRPVSNAWHPGELRIVWLLFDELSYDLAFDHPQPGIDLPAFADFARDSVSFSQLQPLGDRTEEVIPSLFLGQPIADMMGKADGRMRWRQNPHAPWQNYDQNATVFAAARRQGWSTGLVGWYNPYCRILDSVLDRCYWTYKEGSDGQLSSRNPSWQNALEGLPLGPRLEGLWQHAQPNQAHLRDYLDVMREGDALIQDSKIRFTFIHLPVPHAPGIFKRPGLEGDEAFDYLGNLLLADHALTELRSSVAATPAAKDTVFIVSSDHSWRVPMWRTLFKLTPAEERAARGSDFDPRPVLMVRFPGDTKAEQIDSSQSAMILHQLLLDLISGKVRTRDDWMAALRTGSSSTMAGPMAQK